MKTDPIIEEIHRVRREHAEKFNYNMSEIFSDLKKQEKQSGRKFVSLPIKRKILPKNMKTKTVI